MAIRDRDKQSQKKTAHAKAEPFHLSGLKNVYMGFLSAGFAAGAAVGFGFQKDGSAATHSGLA